MGKQNIEMIFMKSVIKNKINMTYEEFCKQYYPKSIDAWKIYNSTQEELIGKRVKAIRSGFSCSGEDGREMIIGEFETIIRNNKEEIRLKLLPIEKDKKDHSLGWGCSLEDLPFRVKLINE